MKKYLATVFAFLFLFAPMASNSSSPQLYDRNIQILDTWNGVLFEHDWRACDAVAMIQIAGVYDLQKVQGGLVIAMGMTNQPQHIQINVDGTHQHCQ